MYISKVLCLHWNIHFIGQKVSFLTNGQFSEIETIFVTVLVLNVFNDVSDMPGHNWHRNLKKISYSYGNFLQSSGIHLFLSQYLEKLQLVLFRRNQYRVLVWSNKLIIPIG